MPPQHPKSGLKISSAPIDARSREEQERQDRHRTDELLDECGEVEEDLEKLKGRFELYFLGIDRREPGREREEMKRRVARLKGEFTRNTGLRFRIETLHARFISYERMWLRSAREKEEGTYRRDLMRARRKGEPESPRELDKRKDAPQAGPQPPPRTVAPPSSERAEPAAAGACIPGPIPAGPPPGRAPAPGPTEQSSSAPPPRPGVSPPTGMSEQQLRALYGAYVEAKKRCNEDVSRLSYEVLAKSVAKQVPELIAKYKARTVEFKVVIKEGRAILKAVPRL